MIDILENYKPPALPDDVRETIRSIVVESEKELVVNLKKK
jgi:trimethylamine:corrinoid methyltransferase-like protein